MSPVKWVAVLASVGALGVAACGATDERGPFPPRPADLSIGKDRPCDALSPDQKSQLELVNARLSTRAGMPECFFRTPNYRVWSVLVTPDVPATTYLPDDPDYQGAQLGYVDPRPTTVSGYGAVEFVNSITASSSDCVLAVDAGPGTTLLVSYLDTSGEAIRDRSVGSRAEGCAQASRVAAMVVDTARARVGG